MEINHLDINKVREEKLKENEYKKQYNEIKEYENNNELKVSLINIDSGYRNKIPFNIIDLKQNLLESNPLFTLENSYEIKVMIKKHYFNVGDHIMLENITGNSVILTDSLYFINNFDYCMIKYENHHYNNIKNINELNKQVNIMFYEDFNNKYRLIGNIPINSIIGYKYIYTKNEIIIDSNILIDLENNLNISEDEIDKNFLFIKLPFSYSKGNNNIFTDFYNFNSIVKIDFLEIGGIPLQYLNANYPIDNNKYQSKQYITRIDENYIYFNSSIIANYSSKSGGNNIIVGKIIKSIDGYPNANDYVIELKKSFTNVVRIEILTTEIPFIDFNIKNNINTKKNKLYWKYLEDGDYIYNISIDEGFYNVDALSNILTSKMNSIERIISTSNSKIYNLFEVEINKNTQEVTFLSYQLENLPNSLLIEKDENLQGAFKMTITQANNLIQIGDKITISESNNIGDIPASIINTEHIVYEVNNFNNKYSVIILLDISIDNINTTGNGGPNIKIKIPARTSLLFNYPDTIGEVLGFKNPGKENSITPFNHINSNFKNYIVPNIYDEIGNSNIPNNLLNISNNNYYMTMFLNNYEGIITNSNINQENMFSKILMAGNTGDVMFNTFVNSPLEFDIPISLISQFNIKFYFPDGTKPEFRNYEHSFTLRITEKINKPFNTQIDTTNMNYLDSLVMK